MSDSNVQFQDTKKWTSFGIVIVVVFLIILAVLSGFGFLNERYDFTPPPRTGNLIFTNNGTWPGGIDLNIFFETDSLSAQNPILVKAQVIPGKTFYLQEDDPWDSLPSRTMLIFPNSLTYPLRPLDSGSFYTGYVELFKSNYPREYVGSNEIIYQHEGTNGYVLVGQRDISNHALDAYQQSFSSSELLPSVQEFTQVSIGSTSLTTELKTNNLILALTWLAVAIGLVQSRNHIADGIDWIRQKSIGKQTTVAGILCLMFVTTLLILIVIQVDADIAKYSGEYGLKIVDREFDFEISRPSHDWFTAQEPRYVIKNPVLPLPLLNSEKGVLLNRHSGESVFVGVLPNELDFSNQQELNEFFNGYVERSKYNNPTRNDETLEFKYSLDDHAYFSIIELQDNIQNAKAKIKLINHNGKTFFIQMAWSMEFPPNDKVMNEIEEAWNSFDFCSNRIFGCWK